MANEFDCRECGRHIISIGNDWLQLKHPDLCALCWSIPRWWEDPEMARTFDPDHDRRVPNMATRLATSGGQRRKL